MVRTRIQPIFTWSLDINVQKGSNERSRLSSWFIWHFRATVRWLYTLLRKGLLILTTDRRVFRQRVSYVKNRASILVQPKGRSDSIVCKCGTPKHAWPHPTDLYHILPCLGVSRICPLSTANAFLATIRYFPVLGGTKNEIILGTTEMGTTEMGIWCQILPVRTF